MADGRAPVPGGGAGPIPARKNGARVGDLSTSSTADSPSSDLDQTAALAILRVRPLRRGLDSARAGNRSPLPGSVLARLHPGPDRGGHPGVVAGYGRHDIGGVRAQQPRHHHPMVGWPLKTMIVISTLVVWCWGPPSCGTSPSSRQPTSFAGRWACDRSSCVASFWPRPPWSPRVGSCSSRDRLRRAAPRSSSVNGW